MGLRIRFLFLTTNIRPLRGESYLSSYFFSSILLHDRAHGGVVIRFLLPLWFVSLQPGSAWLRRAVLSIPQ